MESKEHKKGTTTVGVVCKDGVVLAADQLSSIGDFKFSKDSKKIHRVAKNIAITTAGSVGDNQSVIRLISAQMKLYELETGKPSVRAAITLLSNVLSDKYLYSYLPYGLFDLVGGYDTAARLFSIDPVGGITEEKKFSATGSGMTVAYGILDRDYKKNMSFEDAVDLAVKSIVSARKRVSSVGGENVTVFKISSRGINEVPGKQVKNIVNSC